MFIHVGENFVVQSKDVIAFIDGDLLHNSTILKEFFDTNQTNIIEISKSTVKSIVITKEKIYLSPLSTATLKRRSQYVSELEILGE